VLGREQEICAKKQARIGSDASEMTIEQGPGVCEVNAPGASTAALAGMRSHDWGAYYVATIESNLKARRYEIQKLQAVFRGQRPEAKKVVRVE